MSKNGTPPTTDELPSAPGAPAPEQVLAAQLDPILTTVLGTMIRGLLVSVPGVRQDLLLSMVAFRTGALLAACFQGDLATLLTIRKNLKDGFDKGVKSAPL